MDTIGTTLNKQTISTISRQLRTHKLTSQLITETCLEQISLKDKTLNAFIAVFADEALQQACEADRELKAGLDRGPLHGIPLSLKDLIDVRGVPTTAASRVRKKMTTINSRKMAQIKTDLCHLLIICINV